MRTLLRLLVLGLLLLSAGPTLAEVYTNDGRQVVLPYTGVTADTWSATGDQDNTTDTSIKAARSGLRHCVTSAQVYALDTLGADHQFRILSNDTVLWVRALSAEGMVGAAGASEVVFPVPLCTAVGEALEVDTAGDPTDNLIFYNLQGYTTP